MIRRGDIVLLDMPFAQGGGSKIRPALVIQCDTNNARLANTIVVAITRNTLRVSEPTQLLIDPATPEGSSSGLLAASAITCENVFTVGNSFIFRKLGDLSPSMMAKVNECLKASFGLQ